MWSPFLTNKKHVLNDPGASQAQATVHILTYSRLYNHSRIIFDCITLNIPKLCKNLYFGGFGSIRIIRGP